MKRKKKNVERAFTLKTNINKFKHLIHLPLKNNINFNTNNNLHFAPLEI